MSIGTRTGTDGITRPTLTVTPESNGVSLDVMLSNGTLLARINVFAGTGGWADIDVIPIREGHTRSLSFDNGKQTVGVADQGCYAVEWLRS